MGLRLPWVGREEVGKAIESHTRGLEDTLSVTVRDRAQLEAENEGLQIHLGEMERHYDAERKKLTARINRLMNIETREKVELIDQWTEMRNQKLVLEERFRQVMTEKNQLERDLAAKALAKEN